MAPASACALDGVRVVEIAEGWSAAALTGRLLADMGALVAKLESAEGDPLRGEGPRAADGQSAAFHLVAAGKRSVTLDGPPAARCHTVGTLLSWADVLVADVAGLDVLRALDVAPAGAIAARWPHLVTCAITPYGLSGPLSGWTAGELTLQATAGVMACTGYSDRDPTRAGVPLAAHVTALIATMSALAALRTRERGGRGQLLDVAAHDCVVNCLGTFLPTYFLDGRGPARIGNRHTMGAPWNAFPCRDGGVIVCALTDSQWRVLVRGIGREDLVGDDRYYRKYRKRTTGAKS